MAANLNPSDKAVRPDVLELIRQSTAAVPAPLRAITAQAMALMR